MKKNTMANVNVKKIQLSIKEIFIKQLFYKRKNFQLMRKRNRKIKTKLSFTRKLNFGLKN